LCLTEAGPDVALLCRPGHGSPIKGFLHPIFSKGV